MSQSTSNSVTSVTFLNPVDDRLQPRDSSSAILADLVQLKPQALSAQQQASRDQSFSFLKPLTRKGIADFQTGGTTCRPSGEI